MKLCVDNMSGFFLDAYLEVIGGSFLRYLELFGKFIKFLATLLELLILLNLKKKKPPVG